VAWIACLAAARGSRVLILSQRDELIQDLVERIRAFPGAPAVGIVQGTKNQALCPIVVASIASLSPVRLAKIIQHAGGWDLVITDECHHATAPTYAAVYASNEEVKPKWKHVGFTATPFRSSSDGSTTGLGAVFCGVIYRYGIGDAIAAGDLVPVRALEVSTQLSIEGCRLGADGDFIEADLDRLINCEPRNQLVVDKYVEHCGHRPALVFCASIQHSKDMADRFVAAGVKAAAVWGTMPRQDRESLITTFRERPHELPVLCSKDLLLEGFDAPATAAVLKARPTKSLVLFTQVIGRGLRLYPGKAECLFVDFVDNGCEMDLCTIEDLSEPQDQDPTALIVGDWVRRRHHADWGRGRIAAIHDVEATVNWPDSKTHPGGDQLCHPVEELVRARAEAEETEEPKPVTIQPTLANVQEFDLVLLPGQPKSRTVGWYEYQGGFSASGRYNDGCALSIYVMRVNNAWQVWARKSPPAAQRHEMAEEIAVVDECPTMPAAIERGQSLMRAENVRHTKIDADWQTDPATGKQTDALMKWGIRRDMTRMSKGEASALLDAVVTRRKVLAEAKTRRMIA
jgi:superfamily II DNA or RNA helicase